MIDLDTELSIPALIGVAFGNRVIFNIVDRDPDFIHTGLSVIQQLKNNKNEFIAKLIESQSYNSIKHIFDDEVKFGDYYDKHNENIESYSEIMRLIQEENSYEYFYIVDMESDTLIIKIPLNPLVALDYTHSNEVRDFINNIN